MIFGGGLLCCQIVSGVRLNDVANSLDNRLSNLLIAEDTKVESHFKDWLNQNSNESSVCHCLKKTAQITLEQADLPFLHEMRKREMQERHFSTYLEKENHCYPG